MGPIISLPGAQLGSTRMTIRGAIDRIVPARTSFFGLIKKPTQIKILLDDEPRRDWARKHPAFELPCIITSLWPDKEPLPKVGARVWIQFAFAGELEQMFQKKLPSAVVSSGFIKDESELYGNEQPPVQNVLPKLLVA